ncbi:MAG: hypothetical protein KGQ57_05250 [Burkholderiales bacterium]|nr:hypothetical protein [Burkholderiales bacterium]
MRIYDETAARWLDVLCLRAVLALIIEEMRRIVALGTRRRAFDVSDSPGETGNFFNPSGISALLLRNEPVLADAAS